MGQDFPKLDVASSGSEMWRAYACLKSLTYDLECGCTTGVHGVKGRLSSALLAPHPRQHAKKLHPQAFCILIFKCTSLYRRKTPSFPAPINDQLPREGLSPLVARDEGFMLLICACLGVALGLLSAFSLSILTLT